jgi:TRAP-type mannitol/chloroaromatic compound transport system permease small subunit
MLGARGPALAPRARSDQMNALLLTIDKISAGIGKTFGWTIIVLTLGASYEVIVSSGPVRSLTGSVPTTWGYDFSYIMYGTLLLMTGAYTLSRNGHVRGDFLYRKWSPRFQAGMDLTIYIVGFVPAILALIYAGWQFAESSWQYKEKSIFSPAGVPVYTLKTLIPIAAGLLLMQGIAEMIRCIMCLRTGAWPQRLADIEELETAIMHEQQRIQEAEAKAKS